MTNHKITPEKEKGIKFEIWLESLLKKQGYQNVLRNVEYHKERYLFRQADLSYNLIKDGRIYLAVVEAKFSSNGSIPYKLRSKKKKKGHQVPIDNLVDEVLERQQFIGADLSFLVTNKEFKPEVGLEAEKKGITVVTGSQLSSIYKKLGFRDSIDDSIKAVDLDKYNLNKNIVYN